MLRLGLCCPPLLLQERVWAVSRLELVCVYEAACVDREQMLANVRVQFALLALGSIAGIGTGWNRVEAERGHCPLVRSLFDKPGTTHAACESRQSAVQS